MSNVIRFHQLSYPLCDFTLSDISSLGKKIKINYSDNGQEPFLLFVKGSEKTIFKRDTKENIANIAVLSFVKLLDLIVDSSLSIFNSSIYRTSINSNISKIDSFAKDCIKNHKTAWPGEFLFQFIDTNHPYAKDLLFCMYNIFCGYSIDSGLKIYEKAYEELRDFTLEYPNGLSIQAAYLKQILS